MKLKQLGINKSCWFFHNIWWKICLKKIFLSCVWFFEPRRYPANWAKHFPSTAQLAGYLLSLINHMHERNIFSKQSFNQQNFNNTKFLSFLPYPPYYIHPFSASTIGCLIIGSLLTVQRTSVRTKLVLCTKWRIYTMLFYYVKMPASSSP